jgi:hypothetical protein
LDSAADCARAVEVWRVRARRDWEDGAPITENIFFFL